MPELSPFSRHENELLRAVGAIANDAAVAGLFPVRLLYITAQKHLCGTELILEPGNPEPHPRPLLVGGYNKVPAASLYPVRALVITADGQVAVFRVDDSNGPVTRVH